MGFMKKLFGGADGIREAMRESYTKHLQLAQERAVSSDGTPHAIGLYGALGSRYRVSSRQMSEPQLWAELAPFLAMPQAQSVEMLAEYVAFQEIPQQANIRLLSEAINLAVESGFDDDQKLMGVVAFMNHAPWCSLLNPRMSDVLRTAALELQQK